MKRLCCNCKSQLAWMVPPSVFSMGTSSKCTLPLLIASQPGDPSRLIEVKKSLKATRNESLCFFPKKYPPKLPPKRRKSFIKGWIAHGFHSFPAHQGIGRLLASSALETICGAKTKVGSLGQFCLRMLISNAWRIRICKKKSLQLEDIIIQVAVSTFFALESHCVRRHGCNRRSRQPRRQAQSLWK